MAHLDGTFCVFCPALSEYMVDFFRLAEDSGAMLSSRDEAGKLARRKKRYGRYLKVCC